MIGRAEICESGGFLSVARINRRLAAVLAADVAGYSRLMGLDEEGTLARLKAARRTLVDPTIAAHRGRIVKTTGDGMLVEFASAVDAVRCAIEVQHGMAGQSADGLPDTRIEFRIGIHVGDIIFDDNDIFGDGVNIAARLEGIAEPGGICISDDTYRQIRDRVDTAFDDKGETALKNIARPVRVFALVGAKQPATKVIERETPLALPDKPSIAVLPFQNMSGGPEQDYFADGMVEDIITALSRFKSLFVIARNSSFTYKGKAVDIKQVGRELGVRYVLEGSVRKAGGRVRITGQLIEAATGTHLWADKFDGSLEDVLDLQDQMTTNVVGAIAPALDKAEMERAKRKPIENLHAYDCFLQSLAAFHRSTRESLEEALRLCYRATELDPELAAAYGLAAECYKDRKIQGWVVDKAWEEMETRRVALRASALGQDDAITLCRAGFALFYVCGDEDIGRALMEKALSLNQNLARAWSLWGAMNLFLGNHEAAIDYNKRALRLSPLDSGSHRWESNVAAALMLLGRYEEALSQVAKALARQPTNMLALRTSVVANALSGNIGEAQKVMARLREQHPTLRLSTYWEYLPYRRPEDIERMLTGLRLAGLPE